MLCFLGKASNELGSKLKIPQRIKKQITKVNKRPKYIEQNTAKNIVRRWYLKETL